MWLPKDVTQAVGDKNIVVYYMTRAQARIWNNLLTGNDLRVFCGWYWHEKGKPSQEHGAFRSQSAAVKNAFEVMALRRAAAQPKPQVVRGSGVTQAPVAARTSYASKAADRRARAEAKAAEERKVIQLADRRPTRAQQRQIDKAENDARLRRSLKRQGLL